MSKGDALDILLKETEREAYNSGWRDWDDYENNRLAAIRARIEAMLEKKL